jgi:hypothetical protein
VTEQSPELAALARERGFKVHAGMTNEEILDLLAPTLPTEEQLRYLAVLAGRDDLPIITFAQAWKAIDGFQDLRNVQALEEMGWSEGDVLAWADGYWRIERIYGAAAAHRCYLRRVELEAGEGQAKVVPTKECHQSNPFTLRGDGARKVNLAAWPVTLAEPEVGTT